jgi:excinuclease ABC subunit C
MLQQARDEAHRFAVTYNRKRRSLRTVTSELLSIPGIGPSKRRLLLQTFGSIQGVRDASVEQIAALPGFSASSARKLLDVLAARRHGRSITPPKGPPAAPGDAMPNGTTDTPQAAPLRDGGTALDQVAPHPAPATTLPDTVAVPTTTPPTPERQ